MTEIKDLMKYNKLYLRGLITESELSKEYESAAWSALTHVENYMNSIKDSVYSVAYNTPSDLDEHAKKMTSQLYIMYKFGLIAKDDYVIATGQIEALVKDIQSDYNDWRESHC